jgi:hypothetical protein
MGIESSMRSSSAPRRVSRALRYDEAASTVTRRWRKPGPGEMNDVGFGSLAYGEDLMRQARSRSQ